MIPQFDVQVREVAFHGRRCFSMDRFFPAAAVKGTVLIRRLQFPSIKLPKLSLPMCVL